MTTITLPKNPENHKPLFPIYSLENDSLEKMQISPESKPNFEMFIHRGIFGGGKMRFTNALYIGGNWSNIKEAREGNGKEAREKRRQGLAKRNETKRTRRFAYECQDSGKTFSPWPGIPLAYLRVRVSEQNSHYRLAIFPPLIISIPPPQRGKEENTTKSLVLNIFNCMVRRH